MKARMMVAVNQPDKGGRLGKNPCPPNFTLGSALGFLNGVLPMVFLLGVILCSHGT